MPYQEEAQLETQLTNFLQSTGYAKIKLPNETALVENLKTQLFLVNRERLHNRMLTNTELKSVLQHFACRNVFDCAKVLREPFILHRDDKSRVYIHFWEQNAYDANIFQLARQTTVHGNRSNRYDLLLLINGLPLVQIELKRRGVDLKEAFYQIRRYRHDCCAGLYNCLQLFVISNGTDTKYFSNTDHTLAYTDTFYWTDAHNRRIADLSAFASTFLRKQRLWEILTHYMVLNASEKSLMVMRPYQIHACKALVRHALYTAGNGYIWHTTGSGKTLTAFKASKLLSACPCVKKVFLLVDRRDLDMQTCEEFNKLEAGCIDCTDKTDALILQIQNPVKQLIITTIQKMSRAVRLPKYQSCMAAYKKEKLIFIVDECHRSQFGQMHHTIQKYFQNAQYFGFTGTPRFKENQSRDGRSTADIFQTCLHAYLMKDAILDCNVLGFSVEYFHARSSEWGAESRTLQLEGACYNRDRQVAAVAEQILLMHNRKTCNRKYNALFAIESVEMLVKYYDYFRSVSHDLKIAAVFTFHANTDTTHLAETHRDSLERIIADYNRMFACNYTTERYSEYVCDLSRKVKNVQIDILLVVGMFLTGFDSKMLNTLYIDKNMQYHDLLQAYSRTNRVESATKPHGNIVCFRNLKEKTDQAVCLFSKTDCTDTVLRAGYSTYLAKCRQALVELYALAPTPQSVDTFTAKEIKEAFIGAFRTLSKVLICLQSFAEFSFEDSGIAITPRLFQDYKSKYLKIIKETRHCKTCAPASSRSTDFSLEIFHTDTINVEYIMHLIRNVTLTDQEKQEKEIAAIIEKIDQSDVLQLQLKGNLIKGFLTSVLPSLPTGSHIQQAYQAFERQQKERELFCFAQENHISASVVEKEINNFMLSGNIRRSAIIQNIHKSFREKKQLTDKIAMFIREYTLKYE